MVVYDRENLIKKFHNTNNTTKSNQNGLIIKSDLSKNKTKFQKFSSCCCYCFRKNYSQENHPLRTSSMPHYSFNNCATIEQKQNGYLVYRFTNTNTNTNNNNTTTNSNSNTTSPVHTPPSTSKTSIFCHPCTNSTKKMSNISDEIYQYRRNYLAHIAAEYQFRTDESPCYELKTFENSISPLMKCRSRSFEQSASKIRDLNTELSHSRQLKAAAVAAAAVSTTTNDALKQDVRIRRPVLKKKNIENLGDIFLLVRFLRRFLRK
jgi:hypothetical protein